MTNPYAPPNNGRDEIEQKEKFIIGEARSQLTGALTILIVLMIIISFKEVVSYNDMYYIAISLLGMSFITDMLIIWKYSKSR
jgi:hypothetical protein